VSFRAGWVREGGEGGFVGNCCSAVENSGFVWRLDSGKGATRGLERRFEFYLANEGGKVNRETRGETIPTLAWGPTKMAALLEKSLSSTLKGPASSRHKCWPLLTRRSGGGVIIFNPDVMPPSSAVSQAQKD